MKCPILNIADVELKPFPAPLPEAVVARYGGARLGDLGRRLGAQKLGYNLTVLPPGQRAFPRHNHHVNEEMFFVVAGHGEVRIGDAVHPIRTGDVIACPPGGPETAHQIVNTSTDAELRYLAVSTRLSPEICEYPDSGKFGVGAELAPDAEGRSRKFYHLGRSGESLGYWDGE